MAIIASGGSTTSTFEGVGSLATAESWAAGGMPIAVRDIFRQSGYNQMYCAQPSVFTVVSKLAELQTTLPLKTYRRARKGRESGAGSPYGRLIARPSRRMSTFDWRMTMASSFQIYGEAICWKVRDDLGRPVELAPLHPTRLRYGPSNGGKTVDGPRLTEDEAQSGNRWWFVRSDGAEAQLFRRDLLIWKSFHPDSMHRGLSKLEPLRDALENDAAATAAVEAMWKQGGKPSFVLSHPSNLGSAATTERLASQWAARHGGVANWHKPLILEEGMKVQELSIDGSLEYLDLRKLTDAQVAKVYKLNPAAVGDLDRATFNNIVEILRDVYRSTMPPILTSFEDALDFDVRDGRHGDESLQPDFGSGFYCEHELDGVMRGDFEKRAEAYGKGIQNGWLLPSEVREMENRGFVPGTDRAFINGALVPIEEASRNIGAVAKPEGDDSSGMPLAAGRLGRDAVATVMGRLSRPKCLGDVDVEKLVEGLDGPVAAAVETAVTSVVASGGSVPDLRAAIKELEI